MEQLNNYLYHELRKAALPDGERWTHMPGKYADRYLVSDHQRVFSLTTGKIMKTYHSEQGPIIYASYHHERTSLLVSQMFDMTWGKLNSPNVVGGDWLVYDFGGAK